MKLKPPTAQEIAQLLVVAIFVLVVWILL